MPLTPTELRRKAHKWRQSFTQTDVRGFDAFADLFDALADLAEEVKNIREGHLRLYEEGCPDCAALRTEVEALTGKVDRVERAYCRLDLRHEETRKEVETLQEKYRETANEVRRLGGADGSMGDV